MFEGVMKCFNCFSPMREMAYQHQCRNRGGKGWICYSCLEEQGECKYCGEAKTVVKYSFTRFPHPNDYRVYDRKQNQTYNSVVPYPSLDDLLASFQERMKIDGTLETFEKRMNGS